MRPNSVLFFLVVFSSIYSTTSGQSDCTTPFHDECSNAVEIFYGTSTIGSTCCANPDMDMLSWSQSDQFGVWYHFNSGSNNTFVIDCWNGDLNVPDDQDGIDVGIGVFQSDGDCLTLEAIIGGTAFSGYPVDGITFNSNDFSINVPTNTEYYLCVCTTDTSQCGNFTLNLYNAVSGCTDSESCNYNSMANMDDGSCTYDCFGCTSYAFCNYDPDAIFDDGSCIGSSADFDCNGIVDTPDVVIFMSHFNCIFDPMDADITLRRCDLNGDAQVNLMDYILLTPVIGN